MRFICSLVTRYASPGDFPTYEAIAHIPVVGITGRTSFG